MINLWSNFVVFFIQIFLIRPRNSTRYLSSLKLNHLHTRREVHEICVAGISGTTTSLSSLPLWLYPLRLSVAVSEKIFSLYNYEFDVNYKFSNILSILVWIIKNVNIVTIVDHLLKCNNFCIIEIELHRNLILNEEKGRQFSKIIFCDYCLIFLI